MEGSSRCSLGIRLTESHGALRGSRPPARTHRHPNRTPPPPACPDPCALRTSPSAPAAQQRGPGAHPHFPYHQKDLSFYPGVGRWEEKVPPMSTVLALTSCHDPVITAGVAGPLKHSPCFPDCEGNLDCKANMVEVKNKYCFDAD